MIRRARPALGTLVEVSVDDGALAPGPAPAHAAIDAAFAAIDLVQRRMSFHDSASDVARINRAAPGTHLNVDLDTWAVLDLAQALRVASGGAFNIACAPRLVEWECLPAGAAPAPAYDPLALVLDLPEPGTVRKLAPGWIDLGGIAKGYAVDRAVEALHARGMRAGCVNAGGDLRVLGTQQVAVRDPHAPTRSARTLTVLDQALATSASYFSARTWRGQAVSALVDGRSGAALTGTRSVSVLAPRCALADALTKVVLASGDTRHPMLAAHDALAFII
jgi:thiamine biosynthesis lipoprotein